MKQSVHTFCRIVGAALALLVVLALPTGYVRYTTTEERWMLNRIAEDCEGQGVFIFRPREVLPVQVQNTRASSRDRRMHPAKTVCMAACRAADGSGG